MTLASNELVFINFCADWIRSCKILMPVFDEAAEKIAKEFPESGKVVMGKVDYDKENSVAGRFRISKFPTLKVIKNGQPAKRGYRGEHSTEAFLEFIKKQLQDPIKELYNLKELGKLESNKMIVGYFDRRDQPEYNIFRRVATNLKDDCQFHVSFGEASKIMHPPETPVIVFKPNKDRSNDLNETYKGSLNNFNKLHAWIAEKCVPIIREMTFENAEELTEEGLPFLILFHSPDDKDSIKHYNEIVNKELLGEKQNINFLTADGKNFAYPLHRLGKSDKDLPLIAIDSFKHMYLFPNYEESKIPGKLKHFVQDLYSGKLHREFHYGPDKDNDILPTTPKST